MDINFEKTNYNYENLIMGLEYIDQLYNRKILKLDTILIMLDDYIATVEENIKQARANGDDKDVKQLQKLLNCAKMDIELFKAKETTV